MRGGFRGFGAMNDAIHHIDGNPLNNELSNLRRFGSESVADMDDRAAKIYAPSSVLHSLKADLSKLCGDRYCIHWRCAGLRRDIEILEQTARIYQLEHELMIVTADRDAGNEAIADMHASSGHKDAWAELGATASFRAYHILRCIVEGAKPGTREWEKLMINVRDTINQFEAKA